MTETAMEKAQEAKDMYQAQIRRWKLLWVASGVAFLLILLFFVVILNMLWDANDQRGGEIRDLKRALEILETATGPDAQQRQEQVIENLVITIDCNNREAIQELINQLDAQFNLAGEIQVVGPDCGGVP